MTKNCEMHKCVFFMQYRWSFFAKNQADGESFENFVILLMVRFINTHYTYKCTANYSKHNETIVCSQEIHTRSAHATYMSTHAACHDKQSSAFNFETILLRPVFAVYESLCRLCMKWKWRAFSFVLHKRNRNNPTHLTNDAIISSFEIKTHKFIAVVHEDLHFTVLIICVWYMCNKHALTAAFSLLLSRSVMMI